MAVRTKRSSLARRIRQLVDQAPELVAGAIRARLLWADSLGVKCLSLLVRTPDLAILVDPGASAMQPSFPLEESERDELKLAALTAIADCAAQADVIAITHYHHDHYADPSEWPMIYRGKHLLVKDPNQWINRSQWHRAREFFRALAKELAGGGEELPLGPPQPVAPRSASDLFPEALREDFGSYSERRRQVLRRGEKRLADLRRFWESEEWVKPKVLGRTSVEFADGRNFRFGGTTVRFTEPLFHGIEYATVGWVVAVCIEHGSKKLLFSSDVQGPTIEDYATWIVSERPDILILDGPPTYLFGQLVSRVNLDRAVKNAVRIAKMLPQTTVLFDHHLPRDPKFRERAQALFDHLASASRASFSTLAEWLGCRPLVEVLTDGTTLEAQHAPVPSTRRPP
jgi:predicted metallo-beta-lactamase superfamily hydrolase